MIPETARLNFASSRVGVMESSAFSLQIARSVLFGFGFRDIYEFDSAGAALARLKMLPVDLLICDPYPDIAGNLQALAQLRNPRYGETAHAPTMVVTGSVSLELMQAARQAQVDCVLAKPYSAAALLERILWAAKRPGLREVQPSRSVPIDDAGVIEIW
jgi:CheY-like chemotaxis protein